MRRKKRRIINLIGEERDQEENNNGLENREVDSSWAQINSKQDQ